MENAQIPATVGFCLTLSSSDATKELEIFHSEPSRPPLWGHTQVGFVLAHPLSENEGMGLDALGRQKKGQTEEAVVTGCPRSGSFRVLVFSTVMGTAPGRGGPIPLGKDTASLLICPWTLSFPSAPANPTPATPGRNSTCFPQVQGQTPPLEGSHPQGW